ncbi:hypothetical protein FACS1894208_09770 [Clostridia bacterium]|nr:hypothetical protein FACS1894208_09770 [Clostridia bacterium]
MKRQILLATLLIALLSACTLQPAASTLTGVTEAPFIEASEQRRTEFEYAQKLGDAAVAAFLRRSFDPDYAAALHSIAPLGDDEHLIAVAEAENLVSIMLYKVAGLAEERLPVPSVSSTPSDTDDGYDGLGGLGGVDDMAPIEPEETTPPEWSKVPDDYDTGASGLLFSDSFSVTFLSTNTRNTTPFTEAALTEAFFPGGVLPDITPKTPYGVVTPEFRNWFLTISVEKGLLDGRLFYSDGVWRVYSLMCDAEHGGADFRVFDKTIRLSDNEVGETAEVVSTSPKYDMVRESYALYDSRDYTALYVTDPDAGAASTIRIAVSFSYTEPGMAQSATDLGQFLSGVQGLSVTPVQ